MFVKHYLQGTCGKKDRQLAGLAQGLLSLASSRSTLKNATGEIAPPASYPNSEGITYVIR